MVDAHGGGADFGLLHRAPEGEGLAEGHGHGGDLFLREGVGPVADPLPGPGGVQPPGLKFQGGPGGLPGVVHRRQLRPVSCKGLQGRAAVGDGHLPAGLHRPAVDRQNGLGQGRSGPVAVQGETEPGGGRVGHAVFPLIFAGKGSDGEHMQPAFLVLALVLLSGPCREKKLLCPGRSPGTAIQTLFRPSTLACRFSQASFLLRRKKAAAMAATAATARQIMLAMVPVAEDRFSGVCTSRVTSALEK